MRTILDSIGQTTKLRLDVAEAKFIKSLCTGVGMIKWNAISFIIFIRVFSKPLYHLSFLSLSLLSWRKKRFIVYHFYHDKNDKSDKNDKIFFLSFLFWAFVLSVLLSSVKRPSLGWKNFFVLTPRDQGFSIRLGSKLDRLSRLKNLPVAVKTGQAVPPTGRTVPIWPQGMKS